MVENGRKWSKMGCRGYLVGNGFPRILRHSPTTNKVFCESSVDFDSVDTAIQQQIIYFTLMIILRRKESENSW